MSVAAASSAGQFGDEIVRQYDLQKQLTPDLLAQCEALGDRRLRELVRRVVDDDATHEKRCKLMQEKENYRIYEVLENSVDGRPLVTMKGVLLLQSSSCEEVLDLLATPAAHELYSDLFGSLYSDSAVLYESSPSYAFSRASTASTQSAMPLSTSMGFHWLMLRDLSSHLPQRDFLFMRYHQPFASEDPASSQRVGWGASVWESVEFPNTPPLWNASVTSRSALTKCGFVVESSDHSDATRVTFFVTTTLPSQADRQWLLKVAASVRFIPSAIVNHRIRLNQLVSKRDWVSRDACALCTQTFNKLFKRQHHCRMCGVAVCSKCSSLRQPNDVRVCLSCLNGEDTSALWGTLRMARKKLRSSQSQSLSQSQSMRTASTVSNGSSWDHSATHGVKESWSSSAHGLSVDSSRSMSSDYTYSIGTNSVSGVRSSVLEEFLESDPLARTLSFGSASMSSTTSSVSGDEDDVKSNSTFHYQLTYTKGNEWPDAPVPASEAQRLQRIKTLNLSQQYAKENLKELLDFARTSIDCAVAAVGVVSVSKILLVTSVGLAGDQLPRDVGFEAHALMSTKPLVVLDTQKDERFAMNPLVSAMNIRFYIGLPLVTKDGVVVGALSLGGTSARDKVSGSDLRSLQRIASRIVAKMDSGLARETSASLNQVSGMLLI